MQISSVTQCADGECRVKRAYVDSPNMNLKDWIGRTETTDDVVTQTPIAALSATLDRDPERPAVGTILPPLWHWLYFLPLHKQSEIGEDGHARLGHFLPPVSLPRRMWAGSQFTFASPIRVGDKLRRTSTIENVEEKTGRSGALVFVKVRHELHANESSSCALTEFHDIVYRQARGADNVEPPPKAAPRSSKWKKRWTADEVMLFRYSALTFNSHKIHYDRRHVMEVEGYPGLIVHGPLIATLLLDLLGEQLPQARLLTFEFRAVRPLFDMNHFHVCGEQAPCGKGIHLWAEDHDGWLAMDAWAVVDS